MALHEIVVTQYRAEDDIVGRQVEEEAQRTLGEELGTVRTFKVYRVEGLSDDEAARLAADALIDEVTEIAALRPHDEDRRSVEIAYKPGVMNPEAASIMKAARDLGMHPTAADSSREYWFGGNVPGETIKKVVRGLLMNDKVQQVVATPPETLRFEAEPGPISIVPIREASDEDLLRLSRDKLFLDAQTMKVIQDHFRRLGREPKDAELETIAARWSEHCGHPTFKARVMVKQPDGSYREKPPLMTRIRQAAELVPNFERLVVSAFGDNSGVMRFYDGWTICGKVETHNSPSALDPYGGAATGSGGVFRDILGTGQGAETVISTDMFCFAPNNIDHGTLPQGTLDPDYIQRGVVAGVRDYGNRMGIPTANGSVHYHPNFRAKPTVMVGAYGIVPEIRAQKGVPETGDLVVVIGGYTGRDGIHGATFSSGEMTERTAQVNASAVQIGNAIEEKRMADALLEARDKDLIRALTDCGAAGFSSAIGEMGEDIGVTIDISQVPLKYDGLAPWEIWLSESQERMVAAISPENIEAFQTICTKYNVDATVLGVFDGSHTLTVNYGANNVVELDYEFLKDGLPQRTLYADWQPPTIVEVHPEVPMTPEMWLDRFKAVLAHGNVCSKEPIVRQYDHGVQGGNIVAPFGGVLQEGPNDALVIRPLLGKPYGIVQSHGMNPILNDIDPYEGTKWAFAEAAANYVAVGGDINEAAAVGNYVWPSPDEITFGALDLAADAATEMNRVLGVPVISGKDSLSSTYRGQDGEVIKIPPVYTASLFGRIPDVEKTITSDIKEPGRSTLYLIGSRHLGMGGSTYYDVTEGSSAYVPKVDTETLPETLQIVHQLITSGKISACHDISEGGLATTIAEMCFGGQAGATVQLPSYVDRESYLFSETAGCFIVEVPDGMDILAHNSLGGIHIQKLGRTTADGQLSVSQHSNIQGLAELFNVPVDELKAAWQAPLQAVYHD